MFETETQHGTSEGEVTVVDLAYDEFITGIEGYSSESYICQLTLITNKRLFLLVVL